MEALTLEEKELAALASSFQYFEGTSKDRDQHARSMAKRYLVSKENVKVALKKLRETLAFRQEHNVDGMRRGELCSELSLSLKKRKFACKAMIWREGLYSLGIQQEM